MLALQDPHMRTSCDDMEKEKKNEKKTAVCTFAMAPSLVYLLSQMNQLILKSATKPKQTLN